VGILLTWPLWTLLFNRCVTEVFKTWRTVGCFLRKN
jgi:hypothetical protein